MANIYLRLPTAIAYFHRNRVEDKHLSPFDPWKASEFSDHAIPLRGGLYLPASNKTTRQSPASYSQAQWHNMLNGKAPEGGITLIRRNPSVWLSYKEICQLEGKKLSRLSESYDFLCIQMPYTVMIGDKEVRTNSSFNLSQQAAVLLQNLLVNDFQRALIDWEIGTYNHCTSGDKIIHRGHMDTLERFLMRYDIPVTADQTTKTSLRRQLDRWIQRAKVLEKAYRSYDIEYQDSRDKVSIKPE